MAHDGQGKRRGPRMVVGQVQRRFGDYEAASRVGLGAGGFSCQPLDGIDAIIDACDSSYN